MQRRGEPRAAAEAARLEAADQRGVGADAGDRAVREAVPDPAVGVGRTADPYPERCGCEVMKYFLRSSANSL